MTNPDDFIEIYDDILSAEECQFILDQFEQFLNRDCVVPKVSDNEMRRGSLVRKDLILMANEFPLPTPALIHERLTLCAEQYYKKYFTLSGVADLATIEIKLQKTPPRGGFHTWHCEAANINSSRRVLAWMIYLNDVADGEGETEFIWQRRRVQPKAGRCVIWPAGFTHSHRGNPVYTQDKYIATGWYSFND